jgi:anti-anti-sigma factor
MQSISSGAEEPRRRQCTWSGAITWRDAEDLRAVLFVLLATPDSSGVELDVRDVESIDPTGVALLVAASHRATASGRSFSLVDSNGPVTAVLARSHLLGKLHVTQVIGTPATADQPGASLAAG